MKVKILKGRIETEDYFRPIHYDSLEDKINEFIKDKDVKNINMIRIENYNYMALVMYEELVDRSERAEQKEPWGTNGTTYEERA